MGSHGFGDLIVLQRGEGGGKRGLLIVEEGLRRVGHDLHVDAGRIHIPEAALHVPTAARKRPIRVSGDLEHGKIIIDALQVRADLGRLLAHQRHGLFRENMGMHVDSAVVLHIVPHMLFRVGLALTGPLSPDRSSAMAKCK
jgi:hypothetical protein